MESKASAQSSSQNPQNPSPKFTKNRDFLLHLEAYLAKRDGVDKLLKISRYATKVILATSVLSDSQPITPRLKSFESSVGLSRKAFRLGKFIQDVNSLRFSSVTTSYQDLIFSIIAYGGEGLYYFIEQFVWLAKAGLIDKRNLSSLQTMSAWFEFIGYIGSVSLKVRELKRIGEDEDCLVSIIKLSGGVRESGCLEEVDKLRKLKEKKLMKRLSVVQDLADGLMALADIRDGKGRLSAPLLISSAGLLSAIISTHKNWISC